MGIYLNPGNRPFRESVEKEIYVDKSLLVGIGYDKNTRSIHA